VDPGHQYVFGYASLVQRGDAPGHPRRPAVLHGYRRKWNVAMDNAVTLARYKYYRDPLTGERPRCFVVFLNIVPERAGAVNGALFGVSETELAELDRRERNYVRVEVSSQIAERVEGQTVWTYVGRPAAVERFQRGRNAGRAVIQAAYREEVRRGFAALGGGAAAEFERLTEPSRCPVVALERVST
jgi:cation transport regulator ChaC